MKKLLALVLCAAFVNCGYCRETVIDESVPPAKKVISIDFPDTPLSTVISVLSIKSGYKFVCDSEVAKKRVVMSLRDVTVEEALNAFLETYNLYYVRQGETNIYVIKSKTDAEVTTVSKVFFLNYPTAKSLEPVLKTKLSKNGAISSDEKTNSIIVTDMANNIDEIDQIIRALDIPPLQILLEAKIIDVTLDDTLDVGVNLNMYRTDQQYYQSPLDLKNGTISSPPTVPPYYPQTQFVQNLSPSYLNTFANGLPAQSGGGFNFSILSGDLNVQAFLQALKTNSNAKVLTNPRLVVVNNKEATIEIVEEYPYNSSTTSGIGSGTTSTSVSFKDIGIKLKVRPQISRDGTIILDVSPEQSTLLGLSNGTPIVDTSRTNTTFMLENGETAVIGGLVKETETKDTASVPLLGDIPIIGNLFKNTHKQKTRTELTVLITAKIVK